MKNILQTFLMVLLMLFALNINAQSRPVITNVTSVSSSNGFGRQFNFTLTPNHATTCTTELFLGTSTSNLTVQGILGNRTGNVAANEIIAVLNLLPATTYYYRITATNANGATSSPSATLTSSFTTPDNLPVVSNMTVDHLSPTSIRLNYTIDGNTSGQTTTRVLHGVAMNLLNTSTNGPAVSGNAPQNISITLTGLPQLSERHFRLETTNSIGTVLFRSADVGPHLAYVMNLPGIASVVATPSATSVNINFTANANNGLTNNIFVQYSTSSTMTNPTNGSILGSIGNGSTSADPRVTTFTGLTPATIYYYRIFATNALGTTTSPVQSFTTLPAAPIAPIAQTICSPASVSGLSADGIALKWYADSTGGTALANNAVITTGDYYVTQTVNTVESARTLVNVTVSASATPAAPTAPATYTFCNVLPANRVLTSVGAIGSNLKWYNSATSSTVLTVFAATTTTTYYVSQTTGACESPRTAVSISTVSATPITFDSSTKREAYELNGSNQPVLSIGSKTLADYTFIDGLGNTVSSANLVWYTAASGGNTVAQTTPVVFTLSNTSNPNSAQTLIYHVAVKFGTCESTRQQVRIFGLYRPIPVLGTITSCSPYPRSGFENLGYRSSTIRFYTAVSGGTPIADNVVMSFGTYYASNSLDGIEGNRGAFTFSGNNSVVTWDGNNWSPAAPTATTAAIFNGNYSQTGNSFNACSITVNGSAVVSFDAGTTAGANGTIITVENEITVASTASFILGDKCTLMQKNDSQNTGNIRQTVKTNMKRLDYTYWSSPVAGQNLLAFSPNTLPNRFYSFSETTNAFVSAAPATNNFVIGKGYSVRAPNNFTTTAQNFDGFFTGVPNNGPIDLPLTTTASPTGAAGFNLIGNPYPGLVFIPNLLGNSPGTLYFWTKVSTGSGLGNYASRNTTGGVAATLGGSAPSAYLSPGQGFIYNAGNPATTSLRFDSAMRAISFSSVGFLRTANNTSSANTAKVWLNLTGSNDVFSQTLLAYDANTTNGFDGGYDGEQINTSNTLSTIIADKTLSIQSREAFVNTDIVPMAINIETAGNYNISIDHAEGIFGNQQNVFLRDNLTGTTHNLSQNAYTFVSTAGNFNNRFELRYQNALLGIDNNLFSENSVIAFKNNGLLKIQSTAAIDTVEVFDIRGVLLHSSKNINNNTFKTNKLPENNTVLIVKIKSQEMVVTKKIIF